MVMPAMSSLWTASRLRPEDFVETNMVILPLVLRQVQTWDSRRSGVPGEHWAAFGMGLALLQAAGPGRSPWLRVAAGVAGVAMIWRAASGREGFLHQRGPHRGSASGPKA
jgi:hypothetical protein